MPRKKPNTDTLEGAAQAIAGDVPEDLGDYEAPAFEPITVPDGAGFFDHIFATDQLWEAVADAERAYSSIMEVAPVLQAEGEDVTPLLQAFVAQVLPVLQNEATLLAGAAGVATDAAQGRVLEMKQARLRSLRPQLQRFLAGMAKQRGAGNVH